MNQDNVKELLLRLNADVEDFFVIFSGKMSKKIDGLYHPEKCEIIIHNKNFTEDNQMIYTAIHEFAHHIQFTKHEGQNTSRAHTTLFWSITHDLLERAETEGIYKNVFKEDMRFLLLTQKIKENYLSIDGQLMKEFGKLLIEALDLCQQNHANFEDYVDRILCMSRSTAKAIMKVYAMDVDSEIGFDNMKIVANIKDPIKRNELQQAFKDGVSQNTVKKEIKENNCKPSESINKLLSRKKSIEKSINSLQVQLDDLNIRIEETNQKDSDDEI